MSGTNKPSALSEKDANSALHTAGASADDNKNKATGRKSLDYHRQILQKKMETEKYGHHQATTTQNPTNTGASSEGTKKPAVKDAHLTSLLDADPAEHNRSGQYISPSDTIMSPCTAKLNAFKSRQAGKYVHPFLLPVLPLFLAHCLDRQHSTNNLNV